MPTFLATYDLQDTDPRPYTPFRTKAIAKGWQTNIRMDDGSIRDLPNTTVIAVFNNHEEADESLESVRAATEHEIGVPVRFTRYIIVDFNMATLPPPPNRGLGGLFGFAQRRM